MASTRITRARHASAHDDRGAALAELDHALAALETGESGFSGTITRLNLTVVALRQRAALHDRAGRYDEAAADRARADAAADELARELEKR